MIAEKLDRVLTLLAAAQISSAEFRMIMIHLQDSDLAEIEQRYTRVRNRVRRISETMKSESAPSTSTRIDRRVRDDVISFAREGAANPREAAERLSKRLESSVNRLQLPAFSIKEGFSRWLDKVIRATSPNIVLNAAIAEFSGTPPSQTDGWRLSDT